jgi:hypothetical protein
MLVMEPAEYPEPDEEEATHEAHLHEPECNKPPLPRAPTPHKAVLFSLLPDQVRYLTWWHSKLSADHLDIFYLYVEIGNDDHTEMLFKFQERPNFSVFVTTPKVGGTDLNLTAANHVVIAQKFWILN